MKISLKLIEEKLQEFFEEHLHVFQDNDPFIQLSKDLLAIMEDNIQVIDDQKYIPNIYRISVQQKEIIDNQNLNAWKNFISVFIQETARMDHLNISGPIHIHFFYRPEIEPDFFIETAFSSISSGKTIAMLIDETKSQPTNEIVQAFLITPYDTIFPIQKKITNIGRKENNDLVIDNLRVSRVHAQIREVDGKHLLFDLDSTSGTKVNGQRVVQHTLTPGDVIDIGDVPLIYHNEIDEERGKPDKSGTKSFNLRGEQS